MADQVIKNNQVTLVGKIVSDFSFSHEVYGEGFYSFEMEVPRLSDAVDILPVTVSERLVDKENLPIDSCIEVEGQFRSYNRHDGNKNRLLLTVFAREVMLLDNEEINKNPNQIFLNGFICKEPVYRTTPFGREITDILLAVNRPYNKSDYIPCIAWGRNARFGKTLEVGDQIKVWGRVQSREYQKKLENEKVISKMAYEISISKMEYVDEEE